MLLRLYLPVSSKFGYSLVRKKSYDLILERDRNLNLVYFSRLTPSPLTPFPFHRRSKREGKEWRVGKKKNINLSGCKLIFWKKMRPKKCFLEGRIKYLSLFQLVSGRNWTNPAIWLVPGAGGISSTGPPQRAESVELICFRERISGNRQSFALFTLP